MRFTLKARTSRRHVHDAGIFTGRHDDALAVVAGAGVDSRRLYEQCSTTHGKDAQLRQYAGVQQLPDASEFLIGQIVSGDYFGVMAA